MRARRARRLDRLALPAALRLAVRARRAARRRARRRVRARAGRAVRGGAALPARHERARDDVPHGRRVDPGHRRGRRSTGRRRSSAASKGSRARSSLTLERAGARRVRGRRLGRRRAARPRWPRAPRARGARRASPRRRDELEASLDATAAEWADWSGRARYDGSWRDAVVRSALALRLLVYSPSGRDRRGADDLAPRAGRRRAELGLPLRVGARLALDACARSSGSAIATRSTRSCTGCSGRPSARGRRSPSSIASRATRRIEERELDLPGYLGSRPVRVGNAAVRPAPARPLRDGARRRVDVRARDARPRRRLGRRPRRARRPRRGVLAGAGLRHLGGARRARAVRPVEGDGLRGAATPRAGSSSSATSPTAAALGARARRDRGLGRDERARPRARHVRARRRPSGARRGPARRSRSAATSTRTTRASSPRSPRSARSSAPAGRCSTATAAPTVSTAARAPSSPARSGSSRRSARGPQGRGRRADGGAARLANDVGLLFRGDRPVDGAFLGNFPQGRRSRADQRAAALRTSGLTGNVARFLGAKHQARERHRPQAGLVGSLVKGEDGALAPRDRAPGPGERCRSGH